MADWTVPGTSVHVLAIVELLLRASAAALEHYRRPTTPEQRVVRDDEFPTTAADHAANAIIVAGLRALSDLPLVSEESALPPWEQRRAWTTFWCVDPLDGTKEFKRRSGDWTVNIALVRDGRTVWGGVTAPLGSTVYVGGVDDPCAWSAAYEETMVAAAAEPPTGDTVKGLTWKKLKCPPFKIGADTELGVVTSASHRADLDYGALFGARPRHECFGSSLKFLRIAEGRAHVYPRRVGSFEWDTAAAQAVLEAAGGRVVQWDPHIYTGRDAKAAPADAPTDADSPELRDNHGRGMSKPQPTDPVMVYNKKDLLNPYFVAYGSVQM